MPVIDNRIRELQSEGQHSVRQNVFSKDDLLILYYITHLLCPQLLQKDCKQE